MNKLENQLKEHFFLRIHQSYLVNIRYVKEIRGQNMILADGTILSIPKARCKEVEKAVAAYKGEE